MSRKRLIAYTGIALLVGLALVEKATNSVDVVPAKVIAVTPIPPNEGPDLWKVTFELANGENSQTETTTTRPQLKKGDPVCLRMHERSWAKTKFTLTYDISCWDGVVTSFGATD